MATNQSQNRNQSSNASVNKQKISDTAQKGTGDYGNQTNQPFNKDPNLGGGNVGSRRDQQSR